MTVSEVLAPFSRIAIDTNVAICLIEDAGHLRRRAAALFGALAERDSLAVFSEIGVAECLYGAVKRADPELQSSYNSLFFEGDMVSIAPLDSETVLAAAVNGPALGLGLMDSLHFHAALHAGCDCFVTNDRAFSPTPGLVIIQLSSLPES